MNLRWPVLVTTGGLAVALAIGARHFITHSTAQTNDSSPEPTGAPLQALDFQGTATYRFLYEAKGTFRLATSAPREGVEARLTGRLRIAQGGTGRLTLSEVEGAITVGTRVQRFSQESLAANLTLARDGAVATLQFPDGLAPELENVSRTLLTAWRTRNAHCASPCDRHEWQTREETPFGSLLSRNTLARATLLATPSFLRPVSMLSLVRTLENGERVQARADVDLALLSANLFVPTRVKARFDTKDVLSEGMDASSQIRVSLNLESHETSPEISSADSSKPPRPATAAETSTLGRIAGAQDSRAFLEEKIRDRSTDSVLDDMTHLQEKHRGRTVPAQESLETYLRLKALALLRPDALAELREALAKAPANDLAWQLVAGALVAAGSDDAQATLVDVTRERRRDPALVTQVVILLASSETPLGVSARSFLSELASLPGTDPQLKTTSQLALGVAARTSAGLDPAWANATVSEIERSLARARQSAETIHWLGVAGNAAHPNLLPLVHAQLKNPDPNVRSQAAFSLRFQKGAAPVLLEALADTQAPVREKALDALSFQEGNLVTCEALAAHSAREGNANVRIKLLSTLWQMRASCESAIETVRAASTQEREPRVRNLALTLLGGASPL